MRKTSSVFLLVFFFCSSIFLLADMQHSTAFAADKQQRVALYDMTPYIFYNRINAIWDQLSEKKFHDVYKSPNGDYVTFQTGKNSHGCRVMISARGLSSGLTSCVTVSLKDSNKSSLDNFYKLFTVIAFGIELSESDVKLLFDQALPSVHYDYRLSSIWKNNKRVISWFHILPDGQGSFSLYAVDSPRYMK